MEAAEGDVVYLGDDQGTISGIDTENDQYGVDDAEPEIVPDGDDGQFEVEDEDDGDGSEDKNDEKKDDGMLVVDELQNEEAQSTSENGEICLFCCGFWLTV